MKGIGNWGTEKGNCERFKDLCPIFWAHKQENNYRGVTLNKLNWMDSEKEEKGNFERFKDLCPIF